MAALRDEAYVGRFGVTLGDKPGQAVVRSFAIPVHGDAQVVLKAVSDEGAFLALTGSIRGSGLSDEASSVTLLARPIPVRTLELLWPGEIRRLTNAFALRDLGDLDDAAFSDMALAALGQDGPRPSGKGGFLLVGARTWSGKDGLAEPRDYFADFDGGYGKGVDPRPLDAWRDAVDRAMPDLAMEVPGPIHRACVDAVTLDVRDLFRDLKRGADLSEHAWPDRMHVHMDGETITLCMERRGVALGPIAFPQAAIQWADVAFVDGLERVAGRVVYHDEVATMPHAGGRMDPPPRRDSFDAEPAHSLRLIHEAIERRRRAGADFIVTVKPAHRDSLAFGSDNWDVLVDFLDECIRMEPANGTVRDVMHSVVVRRFEPRPEGTEGIPWKTVVAMAATRDWIDLVNGSDMRRSSSRDPVTGEAFPPQDRVRYVGAGEMFPELKAVADRRA